MEPIAPDLFRDPGFVARDAESALLTHLVRPHFAGPNERFLVFVFDDLTRLIGFAESEARHRRCARLSPAAVRQIFSLTDVANLLLAHNHPSGEAHPSSHDLALTRRVVDAVGLAGLTVCDHVILTDDGHFSFHAAGLL